MYGFMGLAHFELCGRRLGHTLRTNSVNSGLPCRLRRFVVREVLPCELVADPARHPNVVGAQSFFLAGVSGSRPVGRASLTRDEPFGLMSVRKAKDTH